MREYPSVRNVAYLDSNLVHKLLAKNLLFHGRVSFTVPVLLLSVCKNPEASGLWLLLASLSAHQTQLEAKTLSRSVSNLFFVKPHQTCSWHAPRSSSDHIFPEVCSSGGPGHTFRAAPVATHVRNNNMQVTVTAPPPEVCRSSDRCLLPEFSYFPSC